MSAPRVRLQVHYASHEQYELDMPASSLDEVRKLWHYKDDQTWNSITFLGIKLLKYPTDLWIYQELIAELKPDLIVETGTFLGGSALYMATILDALGKGHIITVDTEAAERPAHPRIGYLTASSTDPAIVDAIRQRMTGTVLLILDSDHSAPHVLAELNAYADLAAYIVVEDTNVNGHPVRPNFGPGPLEAVREFLTSLAGEPFEMDRSRERLMLTACPGGFLRRKS